MTCVYVELGCGVRAHLRATCIDEELACGVQSFRADIRDYRMSSRLELRACPGGKTYGWRFRWRRESARTLVWVHTAEMSRVRKPRLMRVLADAAPIMNPRSRSPGNDASASCKVHPLSSFFDDGVGLGTTSPCTFRSIGERPVVECEMFPEWLVPLIGT